jgi:tRNA (guanosine-2'-O-)-methyltransferase
MTPERKQKIDSLLSKRQNDLTVVLENVFDPHNIAAVMRTCEAAGIMEMYIIRSILPTRKRWNDRSSASANKWMMLHQYEDAKSCFDVVRKKYNNIFCTHLNEDAQSLYSLDFTGSTALIFGNEHAGVTEEALSYCNGNFIIPQAGIIQSLNISVACAISIYEAYRQKEKAGHYDQKKISAAEQDILLKQWKIWEYENNELQ